MRYCSKIDYFQWSQLSDSDKLFSIVDNVQDIETLFYNDNNNNSYPDIINAKYNIMLSLGLTMEESMKVAIIWDEKAQGVSGGSFTTGAWRQRDLNAKVDVDSLVSLASNTLTILQSGKYWIRATCPAYGLSRHQCRLLKNNSLLSQGSNEYTAGNSQSSSILATTATLSANDTLKLEHITDTTIGNGFGVGAISSWGSGIFSIMEIIKLD